MTLQEAHFDYVLRLGDNALILAQRLSEWCGHGPVLEQDIALSNIALDLLGQAQNCYEHAAALQGEGKTADDLAFLRDERQFRNVLLVEQENGDWGRTILRQFLFDAYNFYNYEALLESKDGQLAAIAAKSLKEVTYHLRYSSEWTIRLGDGTDESHRRMVAALDNLWEFTGELTAPNFVDTMMLKAGIAPDLDIIRSKWRRKVTEVFEEATLPLSDFDAWMQSGGKEGKHSEKMGFILAEMQYLQRSHPGATW